MNVSKGRGVLADGRGRVKTKSRAAGRGPARKSVRGYGGYLIQTTA